MQNILIEHTRAWRLKHFMVKPFVPIFQRTREAYAAGAQWMQKEKITVPKYNRWGWNFYSMPIPTPAPKKMWPIVRVRRARLGQLKLF